MHCFLPPQNESFTLPGNYVLNTPFQPALLSRDFPAETRLVGHKNQPTEQEKTIIFSNLQFGVPC